MPRKANPLSPVTKSSELEGSQNFDEEIKAQAYLFWLEDGKPEGRSEEHWLRAEKVVRSRVNGQEPKRKKTSPKAGPREAPR